VRVLIPKRFAISRYLFQMSGNENLSPALGKLRERLAEFVELQTVRDDLESARAVIGNVDNRGDLVAAQQAIVTLSTVFCDIDRGTENIVDRASHRHRIRYSLHTQESFVQGLAGKVRRAQAACQSFGELFVIGRERST